MRFLVGIILVILMGSCRQIQEENNLLVVDPQNAVFFDASKDMLDKKIQEDPANSVLYFKRAKLFLDKEYLELALLDIDKALKIEKLPKYYFLKGKILVAHHDTTGLDHCLKQYERGPIEDYEYYDMKAHLLYEKHFFRKALDEINLGIAIAPFYNTFYKRKGLVYLALKDTVKGEKYLLQAYVHDSSLVDNYFELARFYQETNQKAASDKFLKKGYALDTAHYGLSLLKGNNFYNFKKYDSALVYYNKSITHNPTNEESVYQRAKLYMDMFRFVAAQSDWQKVLKLNPNNETAYKYLAICYYENGEYKQSEVLFNRLFEKDTNSVDVKKYLGLLKNTQQKVAHNPIQSANLQTRPKKVEKDTTTTVKSDTLR